MLIYFTMAVKYLNLRFLCFSGIAIMFAHFGFLATGTYANYKIWWADMVLHFGGGFLVGMFGLWFIFNSEQSKKYKFGAEKIPSVYIIILAVSFAALIGVLWEFYEFFMDKITGYKSYSIAVMQENIKDTMSDLFFDIFGSAAAGALFFKTFKNKKKRG